MNTIPVPPELAAWVIGLRILILFLLILVPTLITTLEVAPRFRRGLSWAGAVTALALAILLERCI